MWQQVAYCHIASSSTAPLFSKECCLWSKILLLKLQLSTYGGTSMVKVEHGAEQQAVQLCNDDLSTCLATPVHQCFSGNHRRILRLAV